MRISFQAWLGAAPLLIASIAVAEKTPAPVARVLVVPRVDGLVPPAEQQALQRAIEAGVGDALLEPWEKARRRLLLQAPAAPDPDPIAAGLKQATELFLAQEFDGLVSLLGRLEREQITRLVRPERREQAAALNRLVGVALAARGEKDRALARFTLAKTLAPGQTLDAALYPPALVALFRQAAERGGSPTRLRLIPAPLAGSAIFLDGRRAETVGSVLQLTAGLHYLWIVRPGSRELARLVRTPGDELRLQQPPLDSPDAQKQQLARLLASGVVGEASTALEAVRRALGVRHLLWWTVSGDKVRGGLIDGGPSAPVVTVARDRAGRLWQLVQVPAAPEHTAHGGATPLWKRWWVWTIAGAVVAGAATAVTVGLASRDPVLDIRIR